MTETAVATVPARRGFTTTERNVAWAIAGMLALFAAFWAVGWMERNATPAAHRSTRFVYGATETTARLLAIAHTIVATLFVVTSQRVRTRRGATTLGLLVAASVAGCVGFLALGGRDGQSLAMVLFTAYFFLHDVRDEAWFYAANGDAPPDEARRAGRLLAVFLLAVLVATFTIGAALGVPRPARTMGIASLPDAKRILIGLGIAAVAIGVARWTIHALAPREGPRAGIARHRPLLLVLIAVYGVLMASIARTGNFYALVALHVVLWFVFTLRRLVRAPAPVPAPVPGTWRWMRTTATGFVALHTGILLALAGVAAWWAFGYRNDPSQTGFRLLVSREAFPLWTIVHVTLSWLPRK